MGGGTINYELEVINAVLDTGDMPLALANNVDTVFEVYKDIWDWVKSYYDKYGQLPDKDKVGKKFVEWEYLNTSGSLQYYLDEAHRISATSKLKEVMVEAAHKLKELGPKAAIDFMVSSSTKLIKDQGRVKDTDLVLDYDERVEKLREQIARNEDGQTVLGIPTGIDPLDFHYGGFQPGDLVVLIGWTGSMKSWLARLFAVRAWQAGYRPLVISLEMNKFQEGYRFDTIVSGGEGFRNSQLSHGRDVDPEEYYKWVKTNFEGKQSFYLVTNEGLDAVDQNMVQAKIEQYNPDLVILDYHGLFDDAHGGGNETERAKNLSKDFKRMAVKYQLPIIDIAAVTMEQNAQATRAPELHEIAWSRQLSYDADLVVTVFRQPGSQILEVAAKKNRRGDLFAFELQWDIDRGVIQPMYRGF